jgi:hypothetical protein
MIMSKRKIYYKVVKSKWGGPDLFRSVGLPNYSRAQTEYCIGQLTSSPIEDSYLCIFADKSLANKFAYNNGGYLVACHAEVVRKPASQWRARTSSNNSVENYWNSFRAAKTAKKKFSPPKDLMWPPGTLWAKRVKLLHFV